MFPATHSVTAQPPGAQTKKAKKGHWVGHIALPFPSVVTVAAIPLANLRYAHRQCVGEDI